MKKQFKSTRTYKKTLCDFCEGEIYTGGMLYEHDESTEPYIISGVDIHVKCVEPAIKKALGV